MMKNIKNCYHICDAGEASPQTPGKKETKSRKRKAEEAGSKRQSEYQKRQEELARQMEESGEQPIRSLALFSRPIRALTEREH